MVEHHGADVYRLIGNDLNRIAIENKFNSLERVKNNFMIVSKEFEVGTILTPTMKLRRNEAKKHFAEIIEAIYQNSA
jgi:long-subunit acyl-CoA synthetase (AMP-forming)